LKSAALRATHDLAAIKRENLEKCWPVRAFARLASESYNLEFRQCSIGALCELL
ncbi:MAG: hypothetical protein QOJ41_1285, partial [Acidobacteriaceae bacterium]|nr:hypothetical protein [Acidobacteriaceae bacterium]